MPPEPGLRFEPEVILEYVSPEGPRVTGVRGMLLQARFKVLREHGYFDEFLSRVPSKHRDTLLNALASTWVPVDAAASVFAAIDAMQLSDVQLTGLGQPLGATLYQSMFAALLRTARNTGIDVAMWAGLNQANRVWDRLYNGGGCTIVRTGPKDVTYLARGLSYAHSRSFRILHAGALRGAIAIAAKACVVKPVPDGNSQPDEFTVAMSWV